MDLRPVCKYADKCYRQNAQHQKQYKHPKRKRSDDEEKEVEIKKVKVKEVEIKKVKEVESDDDDNCKPSISTSKQTDEQNNSDVEETQTPEDTKEEKSESEEELEDVSSPVDIKDNLKMKYLVEFPTELYQMWKFCQTENSACPEGTFKSTLNLTLVGPFDVLAGKHKKKKSGKKVNYFRHWRYYYDPPEFTTVANGDTTKQYHLGYYRDDPNSMPNFVASNCAAENGLITFKGENLFAAIYDLLNDKLKEKNISAAVKTECEQLKEKLSDFSKSNKICLDYKTYITKQRDKKVVCKTFHGAGIVVPVDENEVGYRPVPETPADLKKMFKKIVESKTESERDKHLEPLQELITYIQFANDECDYGEGLEMGLDLFTYGGEVLHSTILTLLPLAYQLLRRDVYSQIIESHLKKRRRCGNLSELE